MAFYKIWASRVKGDPDEFVGDEGRLFYDDSDGIIRMSDGATQGGIAYIDNSGGGGDPTGSLDIYIDDFPLTGSSLTLNFLVYSIQNFIDAKVLDDTDNSIVEVQLKVNNSNIQIESNVDLTGHTLRVVHSK
jgi:hypothetical protein